MLKSKHSMSPNSTDTLVGEGSIFDGTMKSKASIRIQGHIKGDMDCLGDVIIGEQGAVQSNISARSVTVAGTVQGNITASEKIIITATGKVFGNLSSKVFVVNEGAVFRGACTMTSGETAKPAASNTVPFKEKAENS